MEDKEKIRLIERECPICHEKITNYVLCGIYLPIENKGLYYFKNFMKNGGVTLMPVGRSQFTEVYGLCFFNECRCGFVSFWNLTKDEIDFLINNKEGYSLQWLYNKKEWKFYLDNAGTDFIKEDIKNTLSMIDSAYPEKKDKE